MELMLKKNTVIQTYKQAQTDTEMFSGCLTVHVLLCFSTISAWGVSVCMHTCMDISHGKREKRPNVPIQMFSSVFKHNLFHVAVPLVVSGIKLTLLLLICLTELHSQHNIL